MEVTIERILPGGLGLAHADGRTVMVALAAPGDRLRVRIDREKGNVAFASIDEVIEPSPVRVEPPCQYFGRCGGCDFQQLSYEAQLAAKVEIIKDCLHRIGRIENIPDFQITPAPNPWQYRTRAQWQYDSIRKRLGYFESGSRRVCDVAECAVLAPELQQTLESLREQMEDGSLPDDARDFRAVAGDDGASLVPDLVNSETVTQGSEGRGTSPTVREGSDLRMQSEPVRDITRTIHGERYRFNAESFFQANNDLLPQLIDGAMSEVSGGTAVELYCGVGLFTVPLARRFARVVGIESDAAATRFARANLASANLENAQVINQDVGAWLKENVECDDLSSLSEKRRRAGSPARQPRGGAVVAALQNPPDYLLLDPPRTGAESRVIAGILNLKPKCISYVSCDPATLARDLRKLIAGGYTLDFIGAFDMFPQTHHVETVAQLLLGP
ncbi:MAG TPA: class I SAM-dependent RNA methyltransferase [Pyrinomonadaceae bacterium]|nr:class I SAM-dependent RNA methyltransferase [Pyrinomonadaceae bacterium]